MSQVGHSAEDRTGLVLVAVALVATFGFDVSVALGVAGGVPYIIPVLLSIRLRNEYWTIGIAAIGCLLTIVGIWLSPDAGTAPDWKIIANRAIALFAIVATAVLVAAQIRSKRVLIERFEQGVREGRSRLTAVLDATQSATIGLDRNGGIALANAAARGLLGAQGDRPPMAWPPEIAFLDAEGLQPLDASSNPVNRAMAGQTLKGELAIISAQGDAEPRYVRISSSTISEDASAGIGTVLVIDDVSEVERNRQQIERRGRLDALGQLTGGVAHDFNNLLATIEYSVQLANTANDAARRNAYLQTTLKSVRRGASLTRRLLAFAKEQPGLAASHSAAAVLQGFSELVRPTIEEAIDLRCITDGDDSLVYCDIKQLENALLNLVLNARDAIMRSGTGGAIVVRTRCVDKTGADGLPRQQDPHSHIAGNLRAPANGEQARDDNLTSRFVEFSVTDDGHGMDEETLNRAIDPFFTTKGANAGTGLGLSMVYGFVQQSGGQFSIYSEPNFGTTVRLLLPRGAENSEREGPVEKPALPTGTGQTILIVEDEEDLRAMMAATIVSLGYAAEEAANGDAALAALRAGLKVDLLLTDVVMPGLGGFLLAEKARAMTPDLPVIYMSGYAGVSNDEMGSVVAPMIPKPCARSELAKTIAAVLGSDR